MAQFPLIDQASLVMIPGAYKEGKIYSQLPTDGSGDFTFTRGTDTATRVNENGLIEKERGNFLLQSNQFDTTWTRTRTSVTSGQNGYDGSSDAWLLECNEGPANVSLQQSLSSSSVATYSVYAKAGTTNWLNIRTEASGKSVWFDLANGVIGTQKSSTIASKIESVGNDWYRLSIVFDSCTAVRFYVVDGNSSFAVTLGANVYIQDAQVEQGLVATDYIETTTVPVYAGLTDNMPRLDYSGGASCPALLLEPQRTNIIEGSEYIANGVGGWSYGGFPIISSANTTSPDGGNLVRKLTGGGATGDRYQNNLGVLGTSHTLSIFIKGAGDATQFELKNNQGNTLIVDIDEEGLVEFESSNSSSYDIEPYGNGWYRLWLETSTSSSANNYYQIYPDRIDGDGSIYVWGAQAEAGSYPTSYIPTYGSSVTRSVDDMDTDFSSALATNGSATIFFHELGLADSDDINTTGGGYRYQKDGNNYVSLATNSTAWRVRVQSGGTSNFKGLNSHPKTSPIKVAIVVTSSTFSVYANGVKELDNESLSSTADFSSINRFQTIIAENIGVRKTLQHLVFPTALTDSECIALTTI